MPWPKIFMWHFSEQTVLVSPQYQSKKTDFYFPTDLILFGFISYIPRDQNLRVIFFFFFPSFNI